MAKKNTTTEGVVATEASVKTKAPKKENQFSMITGVIFLLHLSSSYILFFR